MSHKLQKYIVKAQAMALCRYSQARHSQAKTDALIPAFYGQKHQESLKQLPDKAHKRFPDLKPAHSLLLLPIMQDAPKAQQKKLPNLLLLPYRYRPIHIMEWISIAMAAVPEGSRQLLPGGHGHTPILGEIIPIIPLFPESRWDT